MIEKPSKELARPIPHRIAAGAIVFHQGKVLLVRYAAAEGGTSLVAPGGAVEEGEEFPAAAVRETREETGLEVRVSKPLAIEDLVCSKYRMCKLWFLCDVVSGEAHLTEGARAEGIIQVKWFTRDELQVETVFPPILLQHEWASFGSPIWTIQWLDRRPLTA